MSRTLNQMNLSIPSLQLGSDLDSADGSREDGVVLKTLPDEPSNHLFMNINES